MFLPAQSTSYLWVHIHIITTNVNRHCTGPTNMTNARKVLRDFDLAGPAERVEIIRGLVDRISIDEANCLAKARHKRDILGHDQMPPEIRLMIVQNLDISDVYNCTLLVCRKWKDLFMSFKAMAEDVLQKWFLCLYDKDMPVDDLMGLFSQAITKRYLRDTGRFQSRYMVHI